MENDSAETTNPKGTTNPEASTDSEGTISRRTALKRTAGALAVGGVGVASGSGVAVGDSVAASDSSGNGAETTAFQADTHHGVTCGDGYAEGSTLTVEGRCDGTDCETIRLTGLSPACVGGGERIYADLPGTEPTVWMSPRNGEIPPGTYRVVRAERCERDAGECGGSDLYRLAFRSPES